MAILYFLKLPILIYAIKAGVKTTTEFTKLARCSRSIFIGLILLYAFLLYIQKWNYYLIGYRSTSIVFILTTIAGIVYVLADARAIPGSFKRVLLNLAALALMMGLPVLIMEIVLDFKDQLIYSDSKFRVEVDNRGIMRAASLPVLFKKNFPIERRFIPVADTSNSEWDNPNVRDISKVSIAYLDSGYLVTYFLIDRDNKDSIFPMNVRYQIPGKQ